ncbi:MAG: hypothetical protein M3178_02990 [Pseudomonadota bacterium]|nr:hypothetical protein [Pseudomonadota bacterium]
MSDTPTLYVCNPRLDPEDRTRRTLVFTLTPLGVTNTVSPDRKMCDEVLGTLRIKRVPLQWSCIPFRTSYYSAPSASGADRWRVVWAMSIEVDQPIAEVPRRRYEFFETSGGGYSAAPVEETMDLEYRGIADFQRAAEAESARVEIQQVNPKASPWSHDLGGQFTQLVVGLGWFGPNMFAGPFEPGERVEGIIRKHGGIPNKTEREDTWDIVFNEDGTD